MLLVCGADHNPGLLDSAGTEPLLEDLHHQADREMKRSCCRVRGRFYCIAVGLNWGPSTGQILLQSCLAQLGPKPLPSDLHHPTDQEM